MPRTFAYVVRSDAGFAPNPFPGWISLACCKPVIRRVARPGDLVIGVTSKAQRFVHAFVVEERLTFARYWADARFRAKRPHWRSRDHLERCGDNIYEPDGQGGFVQHPSFHFDHTRGREHAALKARDLGADAVLVSKRFVYFGGDGPSVDAAWKFLKPGRGHQVSFDPSEAELLRAWFERAPKGIVGRPTGWREGDESWRGATCAP
jgi:hypothetical protein